MTVFRLTEDLVFPPPHLAEPDGLLAIGGDLSPQRLLLAYSSGLFPWFNQGQPPLWWCPDPRCIFEPHQVHIPKSLLKVLRRSTFRVSVNEAFPAVIRACADVRTRNGEETWITDQLTDAFLKLHEMGYAHSVECWQERELAGGLYGICMGGCFFGESMFSVHRDSSKVALVHLQRMAAENDFELIDCQLPNDHLMSLGARLVSREDFLARMKNAGVEPSINPPHGRFALPDSGWQW